MAKFDFGLYASDGRLALVVEAKAKCGTNSEWAAKLRRNLLEQGDVPNARFFLLAMPDRLYLWRDGGVQPEVVEPTFVADARPVFGPHFERLGVEPEAVYPEVFEMMVWSWLHELVESSRHETNDFPPWLTESGLLGAVRGGWLHEEVGV